MTPPMRRPGSGEDGLMATLNECSVRHGQACIRLADYDKAKESFGKVKSEFSQCRRLTNCVVKVAELSKGGNKEVPRWLQKCDLELKKRREKELKMYKEIFGSDFKPEAWE